MLNVEAAQVEQRRNLRVDIIWEIADLEGKSDKTTNKLRRASRQTLTRFNFGVLDDLFLRTTHFNSSLISRINDWEDLLDTGWFPILHLFCLFLHLLDKNFAQFSTFWKDDFLSILVPFLVQDWTISHLFTDGPDPPPKKWA